MRIMTVRTVHQALVNAMLERHGKLRADRRMSGVAELALHLGQQSARRRAVMDGVAGSAIERGLEMFGAAEVHAAHFVGMTAQTARDDLFRRANGKGENARLRGCLYVLRAGTVAAFATGRAWLGQHLFIAEMRIAEELPGEVGMAGLARLAAGIVRGPRGRQQTQNRQEPQQ